MYAVKVMIKLTIPGRLPGLNEYIDACRAKAIIGARFKKEWQEIIYREIKNQLKGVKLDTVRLVFTWYEQSKQRDLDNISSMGRKLVLDALVEAKTIPNDGWKNVVGFEDRFFIDRKTPRVEVELWEA